MNIENITPLPWKYSDTLNTPSNTGNKGGIQSAIGDSFNVCEMCMDATNDLHDNSEANAEYIVAACNGYGKIKEENQALKTHLSNIKDGLMKWIEEATVKTAVNEITFVNVNKLIAKIKEL